MWRSTRFQEVDVILWLVEPSTFIGAGEQHIVEQLKKAKTPVILIINKVDTVEQEKILEYIDAYRKVFDFAEIVPASALRETESGYGCGRDFQVPAVRTDVL